MGGESPLTIYFLFLAKKRPCGFTPAGASILLVPTIFIELQARGGESLQRIIFYNTTSNKYNINLCKSIFLQRIKKQKSNCFLRKTYAGGGESPLTIINARVASHRLRTCWREHSARAYYFIELQALFHISTSSKLAEATRLGQFL